jgi:glutamate-ammonia-ligase adenylyltransferase
MIKRHGYPDNDVRQTPNFIIVAYGKLGGLELGHNSDLDLVFIHNASSNGQSSGVQSETDGSVQRCIDNATFYTRLGQKIIHYLSTRTPAGQLYEVDMRLRPSGNSGLLTTSLAAYERYQLNDAWTWEHQALVRARAIAGCHPLKTAFSQVRQQVLCQARPLDTLKTDVTDMRQKMRKQLGGSSKDHELGLFNLKQDAGAIVDIEFMVQYAVLAWAHAEPALTQYTDNLRILESLEKGGHLSADVAEQLTEIYKRFRSKGHRLSLQQQTSVIPGDEFALDRQVVINLWGCFFGTTDSAQNTTK